MTLGALSLPRDASGELIRHRKRHPTIEDHVTIYSGATILGVPAVLACLNEIKQRSVLALTRRSLERSAAAAAPAPIEALE